MSIIIEQSFLNKKRKNAAGDKKRTFKSGKEFTAAKQNIPRLTAKRKYFILLMYYELNKTNFIT